MSMPHFRLLFATLLLLAVPLFAVEIPLTEPRTVPAALSQFGARVASDGDGYLVLWNDSRSSIGNQWLRATRVTRGGAVLDPTGIPLPVTAYDFSVIWTGTSYLVLWSSYDVGALWALRIDREGTIVDWPRVLKQDALLSSVTRNGSEIVVGTLKSFGASEPHALFLTPDAEVTADVKLAGAPLGGAPTIAWNGSHYAAVWLAADNLPAAPGHRLNGVRFLSSGTLDAEPRLLATDADILQPSLASDGHGGFVVVTAADANPFRLTRSISSDLGTVGAPHQIPGTFTSASILWLESSYVVFGASGSWLIGARVDGDGVPLTTERFVIEQQTLGDFGGVPATNGSDLFFAWTGLAPGTADLTDQNVYGTRVSAATLGVQSRSLLSVSAPRQIRPMLAGGTSNLLAVWLEGGTVYAKRLARDGTPLDEAPIPLPGFGYTTDVVFNGTDYIVIGMDRFGNELLTLRVHGDGPLRTDGGMHAQHARPMAAASDGTATLLLWNDDDGIVGASRLREDGSFLDTTPLMLSAYGTESADVAADGAGNFLAVWTEAEYDEIGHGGYVRADVRGARITTELVKLDDFDVAASSAAEVNPAVTWNGHEWLVVWIAGYSDVHGRVVAADGTTPERETLITTGVINPTVAWDGSRYHLGWTGTDLHLHIAQLPRLGGPLVNVRDLGEMANDSRNVYLLPLAQNTMAAIYARRADEQTYGGVHRAFVNVIKVEGRRRAVR
jgi:hypothetical protein